MNVPNLYTVNPKKTSPTETWNRFPCVGFICWMSAEACCLVLTLRSIVRNHGFLCIDRLLTHVNKCKNYIKIQYILCIYKYNIYIYIYDVIYRCIYIYTLLLYILNMCDIPVCSFDLTLKNGRFKLFNSQMTSFPGCGPNISSRWASCSIHPVEAEAKTRAVVNQLPVNWPA